MWLGRQAGRPAGGRAGGRAGRQAGGQADRGKLVDEIEILVFFSRILYPAVYKNFLIFNAVLFHKGDFCSVRCLYDDFKRWKFRWHASHLGGILLFNNRMTHYHHPL